MFILSNLQYGLLKNKNQSRKIFILVLKSPIITWSKGDILLSISSHSLYRKEMHVNYYCEKEILINQLTMLFPVQTI